MAEQVVQVAGEAQAFLLHGAAGQFLAGGSQFPYRLGEGEDRRRHHGGQEGAVRDVDRVPARPEEGDQRRERGQAEAELTEPRAPQNGSGGQAQQRKEVQPVAAVREGQPAGDQAHQNERHLRGAGLALLLHEGAERHVDVEGVEGEQAQGADPGLRRLALEEVGEGAHAHQQPRQQCEAGGRRARILRHLPAVLAGGPLLGLEPFHVGLPARPRRPPPLHLAGDFSYPGHVPPVQTVRADRRYETTAYEPNASSQAVSTTTAPSAGALPSATDVPSWAKR